MTDIGAKQRITQFGADLPNDTTAAVAIIVDGQGKLSTTGLGLSLHQTAAMLLSSTVGIIQALVAETAALSDAAKTLNSANFQAVLAALMPPASTAGTLDLQPQDIVAPAPAPAPEATTPAPAPEATTPAPAPAPEATATP